MDPEIARLHKGGKIVVKSRYPLTDKHILSKIYTPGVAEVCNEIAENKKLVYDYTMKSNMVAIVTDGSAVLGLGDIGPEAALPVMEGKAVLFKELAGINAFPICLRTKEVDEIVDIVKKISTGFGGINLEDISAPRCFEIERRLKSELDIPVFHDDQHGAATAVLAGLINALKVVNKKFENISIVISGAGAAGIAAAKLLIRMQPMDVILVDSTGAIYDGRKEGMNPAKVEIARMTNRSNVKGKLADAVKLTDVFIGLSAPNILKPDMVKTMNDNPIIFALANPVPEIMPDNAIQAGAKVVATGRSDFPNQLNNALVFPGIFKGALEARTQITDDMKIEVAKALANIIKNPTANNIVPDVFNKEVVPAVSGVIINMARCG
jgi:malate dehydrogenase (oxaloacetate-decarboxylating)